MTIWSYRNLINLICITYLCTQLTAEARSSDRFPTSTCFYSHISTYSSAVHLSSRMVIVPAWTAKDQGSNPGWLNSSLYSMCVLGGHDMIQPICAESAVKHQPTIHPSIDPTNQPTNQPTVHKGKGPYT